MEESDTMQFLTFGPDLPPPTASLYHPRVGPVRLQVVVLRAFWNNPVF